MNQTNRAVIISPHLDDAVFSCGDWLARHPGQTVLTVFAGGPLSAGASLMPWDAAAGFKTGDDIMGKRRAEDQEALHLLRAHPLWLDFWDSQYGKPASADEIALRIGDELAELLPSAIFFPLGLFHNDHRLAHQACLRLCHRLSFDWFVYEDAIYRRYPQCSLSSRLQDLARAGFKCESVNEASQGACAVKRKAVACYSSQLRALSSTPDHPGYEDVYSPERYYHLTPVRQALAA